MNERHFVLNLDHIAEGRTAEHPERTQLVIRGKAFTHKRVPGSEEQPESIKNCLIIAIEKQDLVDFFNAVPGVDPDPDLPENPSVRCYDDLSYFEDYEGWDPDAVYCAIIVAQYKNM